MPAVTTVDRERLALEARAETLAFVSADAAVRRGESDRFEIGRLASSDAVDGGEAQRTGGTHVESAHAHTVKAARLETRVDGRMSLRGHSDTTLLGGAMTETHAGAVLVLAGMSDALVAGGGMRVTIADLAVAGLVGLEEKIGSAIADGALVEAYATHFEREYGPGNHTAGFANFTGTIHITSASGFRPLFKVASGVRNLTAGGGSGAGPEGPAVSLARRPLPPPPPPSTAGRRQASLIGDTPEFARVHLRWSDAGDAGGAAAQTLGDAGHYDDAATSSRLHDAVRKVRDPIYDTIDEYRHTLGITSETTTVEAPRSADTADVLSDLRTAARQQGVHDVQRGAVLDLLEYRKNPPLPRDVDGGAVVARLEGAQLEASALLVDLDGVEEAAQQEAVQLYALARSTVEVGNNPQPLLDRLVAVSRWRAENGVEAYPGQADAVANVRAYIDSMFRINGYQIEAIDEAALLKDPNLQAGLKELFGSVSEGAGATDELTMRIAGTSDVLSALDAGGAPVASQRNVATRDPRHLTAAELDASPSRGAGRWFEELSSAPANRLGEQRAAQGAPLPMNRTGHLYDEIPAHQGRMSAPPSGGKKTDHLYDEIPANFNAVARQGSDDSVRTRWQGQAVAAEGLVDRSTDPIYARIDKSRKGDQLDDFERQTITFVKVGDVLLPKAHDRNTLIKVGDELVPKAREGVFPFVPPRLPAEADVAGFTDIVQTRRKRIERLLGDASSVDERIALRFEIEAHDLALKALQEGRDPIPLLNDRIRAAKFRRGAGTPLVDNEVKILSQVERALRRRFEISIESSRWFAGVGRVDEAQQVGRLRLDTSSSLANARSTGNEASSKSGKIVNDFVHRADEQTFGLRDTPKRQRHIYDDINALKPLPDSGQKRGQRIYEDIDALRPPPGGVQKKQPRIYEDVDTLNVLPRSDAGGTSTSGHHTTPPHGGSPPPTPPSAGGAALPPLRPGRSVEDLLELIDMI